MISQVSNDRFGLMDLCAHFALLRRKRLQPFPQTFATDLANVCNRGRKRLRPKPILVGWERTPKYSPHDISGDPRCPLVLREYL